MSSNKNGFSSIALIIIVLLVLGGGYWVWKNQTVTPPPALPKVEGTSTSPLGGGSEGVENWKTYRNDEYGFEFKYPETWDLENCRLDDGTVLCLTLSVPTSSGPARSGILIYNLSDANKVIINDVTFGHKFINGSYIYLVSFTPGENHKDQILSTFRFVE